MSPTSLIKTLVCAALPLLSTVTLAAPSASAALDGKALFNEKCAMCHNAIGMGTGLLARRVDPAVAELEKRSDLTAAYVVRAARVGILNMMPITRGDASDAQLAAIAGYLSKGKP